MSESPSWRSPCSVSALLAHSHSGSLGYLGSGQRVSDRVSYSATGDSGSSVHNSSPATTCNVMGRNIRNVDQECNSRSRSCNSRILFDFLSSAQKRWWSETGVESEGSQSICECQNFQNANTSASINVSQPRGLVGFDRSERCLLPCADVSRASSVSEICFSREGISIQSTSFWTVDSTKSVYQSVSTCGGLTTSSRLSYIPVSRRLFSSGQITRAPTTVTSVLFGSIASSRVCHKSKEVPFTTGSVVDFSGVGTRLQEGHGVPTTRQSTPTSSLCQTVYESRGLSTSQVFPSPVRSDGCLTDDGSLGSSIHASDSVVSEFSMGRQVQELRIQGNSTISFDEDIRMVGRPQSFEEGSPMVSRGSINSDNDGCFVEGLGSSCTGLFRSGSLDGSPDQNAHKLPGNAGSVQRFEGISASDSREVSVDKNRQYDHPNVHKQIRRHKVSRNVSFNLGSPNVVHGEQSSFTSHACRGSTQHVSRSAIKGVGVSCRMGIIDSSSSESLPDVGLSTGGSVCDSAQQEVDTVLLDSSTSPSIMRRRSSNVLGRDVCVCISPSTNIRQSSAEGGERENGDDTSGSYVDQTRMVSVTAGTSYRSSLSTSSCQRSSVSESGNSVASQSGRVRSNRLASQRSTFIAKGLSQAAADTCIASRRASTRRNYSSGWNHFNDWCDEQGFDSNETTVHLIVEYLQSLLDSGKSYNTIKSRVSAIAACHEGQTFPGHLSQHRLIKMFLKGAFEKNPPVKDKLPSWDLPTVLDAMMHPPFEPIHSISLDMLTFKTVFLVAVCSARRLGELRALDCRPPFCSIGQGGVVLSSHSSFLPKVPSVANIESSLEFAPYGLDEQGQETPLSALCVCRALKIYLDVTKDIRQTNQLFVTYKKGASGKPASKLTIARWLKKAIELGYQQKDLPLPMGVKAHSTRAMSASWAELNVSSVLDICRQASWSTPHTFMKHYKLDLSQSVSARHAVAVLQAHAS